MRVLLLAWGVGTGPHGPTPQAAGLARSLAGVGHDVRLVTRRDPSAPPPAVDGVEVHAVADAPPIVPAGMAAPSLDALGFAGRATSVAVRRLEERPVDVVHAEGWATSTVVAALRHSHDVPVLAVVEPWEAGAADPTVAELAGALEAAADTRLRRTPGRAPALPVGSDLPARRPGPPPPRGPVHLTAPPGVAHRAAAGRLRAALTAPRRIASSRARRPAVVVVLDPHDLDAVARGWTAGVPVVTVTGPTGTLVEETGTGVVAPDAAAVAAAVDGLLADRARVEALGAAAVAVASRHTWSRVATAWTTLAAATAQQAPRPRLRATGPVEN